ncbi:tRNA-uridine aminocarboxypropyltransferase [Pseudoalteromonas sp. T1lg65]|uniref:tRNA-uridine aminocarboxypropyltransferase n=1 Tax=Pseudoalteromonas sp. T1lg65 TaxID=2077101 RepID=UPI003F7ADAF9
MKRLNCTRCKFPQTTCICKYIEPQIDNLTKIVILQHPQETKVAKNTAQLLSLQLKNVELVVGESESDFANLQKQLQDADTYLLYPNSNAVALTTKSAASLTINTLILIDATWKKATKIYQLNPWLHKFPSLQLNVSDQSQYTIRKSIHEYSLSTLEATSQFLSLYEQADFSALMRLQSGMVSEQMKFMPTAVKQRYEKK